METTNEILFYKAVQLLDELYDDVLPDPLSSYFYHIGNLLIFDLKKELNPEIKAMVVTAFNSIYEE